MRFTVHLRELLFTIFMKVLLLDYMRPLLLCGQLVCITPLRLLYFLLDLAVRRFAIMLWRFQMRLLFALPHTRQC